MQGRAAQAAPGAPCAPHVPQRHRLFRAAADDEAAGPALDAGDHARVRPACVEARQIAAHERFMRQASTREDESSPQCSTTVRAGSRPLVRQKCRHHLMTGLHPGPSAQAWLEGSPPPAAPRSLAASRAKCAHVGGGAQVPEQHAALLVARHKQRGLPRHAAQRGRQRALPAAERLRGLQRRKAGRGCRAGRVREKLRSGAACQL